MAHKRVSSELNQSNQTERKTAWKRTKIEHNRNPMFWWVRLPNSIEPIEPIGSILFKRNRMHNNSSAQAIERFGNQARRNFTSSIVFDWIWGFCLIFWSLSVSTRLSITLPNNICSEPIRSLSTVLITRFFQSLCWHALSLKAAG